MHISRRAIALTSFLAATLPPADARAQAPTQAAPTPPVIEVSGTGEATVTPDRALVYVGVQTKGRTAAAAGQENARLATAILAAVQAAGIKREQVGTMNYSVSPSYRYYPDGRKPELTGYDATNTVRVEVRALDLVGKVIDAALGAGANTISGISFYASQLDATRRAALASATSDARLSAETMAKAAGGSLGPLLSVTSQMNEMPRPYQMAAMSMRGKGADEATPVVAPTEQTVNASVVGRWQFLPDPAR
ncbi:MAG TPA: SIMPL domain-containing protein [Gemmatimonadaceae bacterium]|nr:SIMPL domain-containing protein [Gemmatimonadaceae bacterium]